MASRPPPNNPLVVRVAMLYSRDTRTFVNTFHVVDTAGWTLAKMQTLATDTFNWWNTSYKHAIPAAVLLYQIQVRLYDPANPLAYDSNINPPVAGDEAGTSEAGNVTATISLRTGLAGRKYRGRMFVPGVSEVVTNPNDTLTSTGLALIAAAAATFVTTAFTGGVRVAIWHVATNTFTFVTSAVLNSVIDSMRRRLPNRGR